MATYDTIIRGGQVATGTDLYRADIGIRGGRVVTLGENLDDASQTLDADGRLVLPGGIDAHCHFDQPLPDNWRLADDFASGTLSAACGGTTTIIPFACQVKGQSLPAATKDYHARAKGKAIIDYAFHLIITDPTPKMLDQDLPKLIAEGYSSLKLYMTYEGLRLNDRQILEILSVARAERAMTMIHSENHDIVMWLTDLLERTGKTAPKYHAVSRPLIGEREGTHRAITLSEVIDVPILIVHVSGGESADQIRIAQSRGLPIYAETCPQYLFLTADALDLPGNEGAKCICSPPPRDAKNQEAIWKGLANGTFTVFSSDHSPFRMDDPHGKFVNGPDAPFSKIPNGIPGIETRLPLLMSEGVLKGRITLQQFVALTASNPARIYGLAHRKGSIALGMDADIVIWDTQSEVVITNDRLHHNVDYTPYEGMKLKAWPSVVLSRGEVVYMNGEPRAKHGRGLFLPCERPA
jgi:dihydropyrimidinase